MFFNNHGVNHASIVMATILRNSKDTVRILTGDFGGKVSHHEDYLNALIQFIASGKRLEILLTRPTNIENSIISNILTNSIVSNSKNIFVRKISEQGLQVLKRRTNDQNLHFTVGDEKMYRIESDASTYQTIGCFNDSIRAKELNQLFDECFRLVDEEELSVQLYQDLNFDKSCSIIKPDFENINLELIEYFSKNPDALQNLGDRKFEKLLDVIFRNHGYITELGPGWADGGIDLRLIQKDTVGQILTLVQAKRYKKENAIRLDAVKALTATVDRENANRGLFVTTSRYLPGVEKWASEQPTKIILAKSEDVAEWCRKISQSKMQLK